MQPLFPRPISHDAPGVLVDNLDLLVPYEIMGIAMEQMKGRERLSDEFFTPPRPGPEAGEILRACRQPGLAGRRQANAPFPWVNLEIVATCECAREHQRHLVDRLLQHLPTAAGDNERNTRLIHQDAVRFVHNAEAQSPEHQIPESCGIAIQFLQLELNTIGLPSHGQAIPQIIERQFLIRAVGHIAGIGGTARRRSLARG